MRNFYKHLIHFCLCVLSSPQSSPPAAQESTIDDTADLLGLNSGPSMSSTSSTSSSAPPPGVQGGMKAASSNSDLLNDLFAPPAGQTAAVQEDLFFSEPASGNTSDSKCKGGGVRKILVTGLSFNIRIHVFIIPARMEVVITYRAYDTTSSQNSVLHMLIYKRGCFTVTRCRIPVQSSIQCLV